MTDLMPWPLWVVVFVAAPVIAWKWTVWSWRKRGVPLPWERPGR